MPFPYNDSRQFAAELAQDYELHEGERNELDAFSEDLDVYLMDISNGEAAVSDEEYALLERLREETEQLKTASKAAAVAMTAGNHQQTHDYMQEAERIAASFTQNLQRMQQLHPDPEDERYFASRFMQSWDAQPRPYKKFAAAAGSYTAPQVVNNNMNNREKWRAVKESNTGNDLPYYRHEDKVNAIAYALAAYKFSNDDPVPAYSEKKLRSAAEALKKDAVFTFLTGSDDAADTYLRTGDLEDLSKQVSNRFVIAAGQDDYESKARNIDYELDALGELMRLDPPADNRSPEWKALHGLLTGGQQNMTTEERVQRVFDAVEAYGKGKKSLRSTEQGQASFDLMMNALAIVSRVSPAAKARAEGIVAKINHVRTHRPLFRKAQPTVNLDDYSLLKARDDVEKSLASSLGSAPRSLRQPLSVPQAITQLRRTQMQYPWDYAGFNPGDPEQVKAVTRMLAQSIALSRCPKYRSTRVNEEGQTVVERVMDQTAFNTMTSDLTRDPAVQWMAREYMQNMEFRRDVATNGGDVVLNGLQTGTKLSQKLETLHRERNWQADPAAQNVPAAMVRGGSETELPAMPDTVARPVPVFGELSKFNKYTRPTFQYSGSEVFRGELLETVALAIALNSMPAYRQRDQRTGEYRAVVDGDRLRAETNRLMDDPAVIAIAQRMVDDPVYRDQILKDHELAAQVKIPEGMPIPSRSDLGFSNKLTIEYAKTKQQLQYLRKYSPETNDLKTTEIRTTAENFINLFGSGIGREGDKEGLKATVEDLASILAYRDSFKYERNQNGTIVEVVNAKDYQKKKAAYENDPAVKKIAKDLCWDKNYAHKIMHDTFQNNRHTVESLQSTLAKEFRGVQKQFAEESANLQKKIEDRLAANAQKWEDIHKAWQAGKEQPKPAGKIVYDEKGIPVPPELNVNVPDVQPKQAPQPAPQPKAEPPKEKPKEVIMVVNAPRRPAPELIRKFPKPPAPIENPVDPKELRIKAANVPQLVRKPDPENHNWASQIISGTIYALAMYNVPVWQGTLDGKPACVVDNAQLEAEYARLESDPAVQKVIKGMFEDGRYLFDLTHEKEPFAPPLPRTTFKFAARMKEEVDAVRKEMDLEAEKADPNKTMTVGTSLDQKYVTKLPDAPKDWLEMAEVRSLMPDIDKIAKTFQSGSPVKMEDLAKIIALYDTPVGKTINNGTALPVVNVPDLEKKAREVMNDPAFETLKKNLKHPIKGVLIQTAQTPQSFMYYLHGGFNAAKEELAKEQAEPVKNGEPAGPEMK